MRRGAGGLTRLARRPGAGGVVTAVASRLPLANRFERRLSGSLATAVERVVALRGPSVVATARQRAAAPGAPLPHDLVRAAVRRTTRRLAASGAATAAPGIVPGAGTIVVGGTALVDAAVLIEQLTELVLDVGATSGRLSDSTDGRVLSVYLVLGDAFGALSRRRDGSYDVDGRRVDPGQVDALDPGQRHQVARALAGKVLGRMTRRGAVRFLGREVPFGVGVAIGAGANVLAARSVGSAARAHFGV